VASLSSRGKCGGRLAADYLHAEQTPKVLP